MPTPVESIAGSIIRTVPRPADRSWEEHVFRIYLASHRKVGGRWASDESLWSVEERAFVWARTVGADEAVRQLPRLWREVHGGEAAKCGQLPPTLRAHLVKAIRDDRDRYPHMYVEAERYAAAVAAHAKGGGA